MFVPHPTLRRTLVPAILAALMPLAALAAPATAVLPALKADGPKLERQVLLDTAHVQMVHVTLRQDMALPDHQDGGPATVQVLAGEGKLYIGNEPVALKAGALVALEPNAMHRVTKGDKGNLVLLVTRIKSGDTAQGHDHHHH